MKVRLIDSTGSKKSISVNDVLFDQDINQKLLAQSIRVYLANLRQGTSKAKTRSEVNRTKKKLYRQKGTGNARHGSKNAPIFVGGGVAHGPTGNENWQLNLSKKMKKNSLRTALAIQKDNLIISDELPILKGKTKQAQEIIRKFSQENEKVLVCLSENMPMALRSLRNIKGVLVERVTKINALDIVLADKIVFTRDSIRALERRFQKLKIKKEKKVTSLEK